jgi:fatty acid desaturase
MRDIPTEDISMVPVAFALMIAQGFLNVTFSYLDVWKSVLCAYCLGAITNACFLLSHEASHNLNEMSALHCSF